MKHSEIFKLIASAALFSFIVIGCSQNETSSPVATGSDEVAVLSKQAPVDQATILRAKLSGSKINPLAFGSAIWEKRSQRLRFSLDVQGLKLVDGKYEVLLDGQTVTIVVVKNGDWKLNLDTLLGHIVPQMKSGQFVEVFSPSGDLMLSGALYAGQ